MASVEPKRPREGDARRCRRPPGDARRPLRRGWRPGARHWAMFGRRVAAAYELYPRCATAGCGWTRGPRTGGPAATRPRAAAAARRVRRRLRGADAVGRSSATRRPSSRTSSARAINDSLREGWLDLDPRFLGSICPPSRARSRRREIERLRRRRALGAGDPARRLPRSRSAARGTGRSSARRPTAGSRSRPTSAATTRTGAPAGRRTTSRSTSEATRSRWRRAPADLRRRLRRAAGAEGRPQRVRGRLGDLVRLGARQRAGRSRDEVPTLDRRPPSSCTTRSGSPPSRSRSR